MRADAISPARAADLAMRLWGIEGVAASLPGEVDENFRLASRDGEYLLKVVAAAEPAEVTDLVSQALLHVARCGDIPVQRIVPTIGGHLHASFLDAAGEKRRARLTTFVGGTMLRAAPPVDRDLRERLGGLLARLALALRDFHHPAATRRLSWDLRQAGRMQAMLAELPPSGHRRGLGKALAAFEERTVPKLEPLPAQIVHNDLTGDNVVLTPDGGLAVIDFGDIVATQRINDVAVAMTDRLGDGPEPFVPAVDLLRGYVEVQPLEPEELEIVYELVRTRVVTRVVGGEWRTALVPENSAYLSRNVARGTALLRRMPERPSAADRDRLASIAAGVPR